MSATTFARAFAAAAAAPPPTEPPVHHATAPAHERAGELAGQLVSLARLPAHREPAARTSHTSHTAPAEPDPAAVALAARRILNAVAESVLNVTNPTTPAHRDPVAGAVSISELLKHFLSDKERRILQAVAAVKTGKRITGSEVQLATGIGKSQFWLIWSELQIRGLLIQHGGHTTSNYTLAFDWLRLILA